MLAKLTITMMVAYPLVAFIALWINQPYVVIAYLMLIISLTAIDKCWQQQWKTGIPLLAVIAFICGSLFAGYTTYLVYLPPILILFSLFIIFWQTLGQEQTPLITRYAKLMGDKLDDRHLQYQRNLTKLWAGFFLLMVITSISLAVFASLQAWSFFTNIISYILVACFFIIEFAWRKHIFSDDLHDGFFQFMTKIIKIRPASLVKDKS